MTKINQTSLDGSILDQSRFCGKPVRSVAGDGEAGPWESTRDYKIESTDKGIDRLVYELYGLSPDEINIVEGKESKK